MSQEIIQARMEEREACARQLEWMHDCLPETTPTVEFQTYEAGRKMAEGVPEQVAVVTAVLDKLLVEVKELAAALGGRDAGLFAEDGWGDRLSRMRDALLQARLRP